MKNRTLILAFIFCATRIYSMSIKEAIDSRKVAIEMTGAKYENLTPADYAGMAPEMQMTVSNLSGQLISLDLEPGYMLDPEQPGYQAMLLTQSIALKLRPNEKKLNLLYAMCTEASKSGPGTVMPYRVGKRATPALLEMALFIAAHRYYAFAAQQAVWCISNGHATMSISDKDTMMRNELIKETAKIRKENLTELRKQYKKENNTVVIEPYRRLSDRNITFSVKDSAMVTAGYYDLAGKMIRPLFSDRMMRGGLHSVRYDPYPVSLRGKDYIVRLTKNGEVQKEYSFRQ